MGILRIDRAGLEDWQRIRRVRLLALETSPEAFGSTLADEAAFPPERWHERVADPHTVYFLANDGETDTGLVRFSLRDGIPGLFSMWVAPAARGRGVGRALVERVIAEAVSRGHTQLFLGVVDTNAQAIRLYERCGFHPTGRVGSLPPPRSHIREHERVLDLRSRRERL